MPAPKTRLKSPESIAEKMNRRNLRPAVFLDRDGVINVEKGFLSREEDMELIEGAAEGVARINAAGWLAIVVTNQPVIARGDCSWEELGRINARMETLLGRGHAFLNDIITVSADYIINIGL